MKFGGGAAQGAGEASTWLPPARLPENAKERAQLVALEERMAMERQAEELEPGTRIEDCSCPRGGGWRPGARWARREEMLAEVEALPVHQRPPIRELGRRTEAAQVPFKRKDEIRSSRAQSRGVSPAPCQRPSTLVYPERPPQAAAEGLGTNETEVPLITAHRIGNRVEIAACCPAARRLGLHPGMPLTQARAMIPGLDIRDAEPEAEAAFLTRLALFAARRWTPGASVSDSTGLWLDLSGVTHLFGGERAMCARILRFCARLGYSARIAVAGTPGAAHALARHAGAPIILCPEGGEAEAIADLPLAALRIEEAVESAARRLGLERIGELAAMPRGPLNRRFRQTLLTRLDQALGRIAEPIDPIIPEEPPSAAFRFPEPIASAEAIAGALDRLMETLIGKLEKRGLGAKRVLLRCLRIDGEEQGISIGTARATRDAAHLLRLLKMKIETIEPGFGIEAMELSAERCEPLGPQPIEGPIGGEKPAPDLVPLIDRLAGRLGTRCLFHAGAVESDVPERSVTRVPPLTAVADWPDWPRPVRLLVPPEPVEQVIAELPDQAPVRFSWRGRMHKVRRSDGPERIYGEWWKSSAEADAVRDYFQVEDEEGSRFWLYRRGDGEDPRTGDLSWWLQGTFG